MPPKKPVAPGRPDPNADIKSAIRGVLVSNGRPKDVAKLVTVAVRNQALGDDTITKMVNALAKEVAQDRTPTLGLQPKREPGFLDPDNLPEGTAMLKDVARELGITPEAIHGWINRGRMKEVGRVGGKGSGIGGFVVVNVADAYKCHGNPRRGGRPRKKPAQT